MCGIQPVNLTPAERLELQVLVQELDTEANRYYRYDYYRDNCSTRVRDVLDRVLRGQIRAATEDIDTGTTYRWHTARLLQSAPAAYAGIQFVVGNRGDETISAWEEMFLPLRLKEHLDGVRIVDAEGESGPLLGEAVQVVEAVRDPLPLTAPDFLFPLLLLGTALGALFAGLGWMAGEGKRWSGWALALSGFVWSGAVGLLGTALLLSWFFTDHVFWALNENAFQANPVSLVLAGVLLREALKGNGHRSGIRARIPRRCGSQDSGRRGDRRRCAFRCCRGSTRSTARFWRFCFQHMLDSAGARFGPGRPQWRDPGAGRPAAPGGIGPIGGQRVSSLPSADPVVRRARAAGGLGGRPV